MANRQLTKKVIDAYKKHGEQVLEEFDEALESKQIKPLDIDLNYCVEQDFGPNFKEKIMNMDSDAMEAIVTSGTFNKMVQRTIRYSLQENPREEYKLSAITPVESRGECEESFKDWGVFSDIKVHELCELEPSPLYGVASDYLEHPNGKTVGAGIAFTREAMCKDPNGFAMQQVPKIADAHNLYREEKLVDTLIGYNATYDRSGTLYDIFYEDGATGTPFDDGSGGPWINAASLTLTCGEDLQTVKNLFYDMTDLVHGRPMSVDVTNLNVFTSQRTRDRILPLLNATSVEKDATCPGSGDTVHYFMTPEVANGMTFNPMEYQRLISAIVSRYSLTQAQANEWIFFGKIPEFMAWVYQIRPSVTRLNLSEEAQRRRIVAQYDSISKGYAYVKEPQKAVWLTGDSSEST